MLKQVSVGFIAAALRWPPSMLLMTRVLWMLMHRRLVMMGLMPIVTM